MADDWLNQAVPVAPAQPAQPPADDWLNEAQPVAFDNVESGSASAPLSQFRPSIADRIRDTGSQMASGVQGIAEDYQYPPDDRREIGVPEGTARGFADVGMGILKSAYDWSPPGILNRTFSHVTGLPSQATAVEAAAAGTHQAIGINEDELRFSGARDEAISRAIPELAANLIPVGGAAKNVDRALSDLLSPEAKAVMRGDFVTPEAIAKAPEVQGAQAAEEILRTNDVRPVPATEVDIPKDTTALQGEALKPFPPEEVQPPVEHLATETTKAPEVAELSEGDLTPEEIAAFERQTLKPEDVTVANPEDATFVDNGSGESSASIEAQNRLADEKAAGQHRMLIEPNGEVRPLVGVDAVDAVARPGQVIVQRGIGSDEWTVLSHGDNIPPRLAQSAVNRSRGNLDAAVQEMSRSESDTGIPMSEQKQGLAEDRGPLEGPIDTQSIPFESADALPPRLRQEASRASEIRGIEGEVPAAGRVAQSRSDFGSESVQRYPETGRSIPERLRTQGASIPVPAEDVVSVGFDRGEGRSMRGPATQGGFIGTPPIPPSLRGTPPSGPSHPGTPANVAPNYQYVHDALANLGNKGNARIVRDIGRRAARGAWAEAARNNVKAANAVETAGAHFDRRPKALRSDPMKAMEDVIQYQKGGIEAVKDPMAKSFMQAMEGLLNQQVKEIQSFGTGHLQELRNNYFRQEWEPIEGTKPGSSGLGNKPLGGNKSFTKERVFDTFEDGIKAGYKPKFDNPVDFFLNRYQSGEKLKASLQIRKDLEDRGAVLHVKQGDRVPIGFGRINDPAFAGVVVPEVIANDFNNFLSPGFNQYAGWRAFRKVQNRLISARLSLSAFHAGLTTLDTVYTHAALGLQRAAIGDLRGGLRELVNAISSPVMSPIHGKRLLDQFYGKTAADPQIAAILDLLSKGGARGRMGDSHPEFNDDFAAAKRALTRGEWGELVKKGPFAIIEAISRPMLNHLVPYQKMVSRTLLMAFELDRVAGKLGKEMGDYKGVIEAAHPDFLAEIAKRVDDDVSNRLGQHTYDNYFWNKHLREVAHASVTSVGWNVGALNFIVGGAADARRLAKPERLAMPLNKEGTIPAQMSRVTTRLTYLVTMTLVHFGIGAALMYGMTGKMPETFKDLYFPRTGRKNKDGSDERLALPDFVKEQYAVTHHPVDMLKHKLHPSWGMGADLLENKDFFGTQVYDPDANIPEQVKDVLTYLLKSFAPYSATGVLKNAETGKSAAMTALPLIGVTPASGSVSKSDFQAFVDEKYFDKLPRGARRQEDAERSAKYGDAVSAARRGESPNTEGLTDRQLRRMEEEAQHEVPELHFAKLDPRDKVKAFELATPKEREQYSLQDAAEKAIRRSKTLTYDEKEELLARLTRVND